MYISSKLIKLYTKKVVEITGKKTLHLGIIDQKLTEITQSVEMASNVSESVWKTVHVCKTQEF